MCDESRKFRSGVTMVELTITMAIFSVMILVVGVLLASGQRVWRQGYDSAHKQIKQDAQIIPLTFARIARKANRLNYIIYNVNGNAFTHSTPQGTEPEEVVSGNAVEFRYWDVELDAADSHGLLDVTKLATAYALFYIDGDQLKVDYGPYPSGASGGVNNDTGTRNTSNVTTTILAENVTNVTNVTTNPNTGAFSHTTLNGVGQGCVRINITLTDPENGDSIDVTTAVLMRNIWPR